MKPLNLTVLALALAATLVACAPSTDAAQTEGAPAQTEGTPAPTPAPAITPAAIATGAPVTPAPLGSPAPSSPEPAATPTIAPLVVPIVAPDALPQILSFSISATLVHPGDVLSGSVTASSNVASVEVRVAGYSYGMTKTAPGQFSLAVTIPDVPKMFRKTYPLVAIARNTRGDSTERSTQITIQ